MPTRPRGPFGLVERQHVRRTRGQTQPTPNAGQHVVVLAAEPRIGWMEGWQRQSDVAYFRMQEGTTSTPRVRVPDSMQFLAGERTSPDCSNDCAANLRCGPGYLTAPTGALATLGVVLDDQELVLLLERIEALDERVPARHRRATSCRPTRSRFGPDTSVHEAAQITSEHRISGAPVVDRTAASPGSSVSMT